MHRPRPQLRLIHLRDTAETVSDRPGQVRDIPKDVAEFQSDLVPRVTVDSSVAVAEDFLDLVGQLAGLTDEADRRIQPRRDTIWPDLAYTDVQVRVDGRLMCYCLVVVHVHRSIPPSILTYIGAKTRALTTPTNYQTCTDMHNNRLRLCALISTLLYKSGFFQACFCSDIL